MNYLLVINSYIKLIYFDEKAYLLISYIKSETCLKSNKTKKLTKLYIISYIQQATYNTQSLLNYNQLTTVRSSFKLNLNSINDINELPSITLFICDLYYKNYIMRVKKAQLYLNQLRLNTLKSDSSTIDQEETFSTYCNAIKFFYNCQTVSSHFFKQNQIQSEYYVQLKDQYAKFLTANLYNLEKKNSCNKVFAYCFKQNLELMSKMGYSIKGFQLPQLSQLSQVPHYHQYHENNTILDKSKGNISFNTTNQFQQKDQISLKQEWQYIVQKYEQYQIDKAFGGITEYVHEHEHEHEHKNAKSYNFLKEQIFMQKIRCQYEQMIKYHNLFSLDSFNFDTNEHGMASHYKFSQNRNGIAISYHIQGQLDITIQNLMTILRQIQLYPKCVPFNVQASQLKRIQINKIIGVTNLKLPFLNKFPFYFVSYIYDRLKQNNSIYFCARQISSNETKSKYECHNVPETGKLQINFRHLIIQYRPISKNRANMKMLSSLQINLPFSPKFLILKTLRTFSFNFFQNVTNINKNFQKSEWYQLQRNNIKIYECFKQKISKHLETLKFSNVNFNNNQHKKTQKDYSNQQNRSISTNLTNKIQNENNLNSQYQKSNKFGFKIPKLLIQQQSMDFNQNKFNFKQKRNLHHKNENTEVQFQVPTLTVQEHLNLQNEEKMKMKIQIQMKSKFQLIVKTYDSHRLDQANSLLQQYKQLKIQNEAQKQTQKSLTSDKNEYQESLIQQIQTQYAQMTKYYSQFNLSQYKFDKQENGMVMYYKTWDNQNLIATHIQGQADISLQRFLCLVYELNLSQNYVPFNYETLQVKKIERNRKICVSRVSVPLISNKEYYFLISIYDKLEQNGSVFLYSKKLSIEQAKEKYNYQIPKSDISELDFRFFILEYKPISKTRGWLKMGSCAHLDMMFVPNFIKNKTSRIFSFDYIWCMLKTSKKFQGSQWQKAILQKPQIYDCFKQKLQIYFEKHKEKFPQIEQNDSIYSSVI